MNYNEQAANFAAQYGLKLKTEWLRYGKHFGSDKERRHIFRCKLRRGGKSYTFEFGQSIAESNKEPTMYDVLSCIQKYDVGSFADFCAEFGYNDLEWTSKRTYNAVCREYNAMLRLFPEAEDSQVWEELREIQ